MSSTGKKIQPYGDLVSSKLHRFVSTNQPTRFLENLEKNDLALLVGEKQVLFSEIQAQIIKSEFPFVRNQLVDQDLKSEEQFTRALVQPIYTELASLPLKAKSTVCKLTVVRAINYKGVSKITRMAKKEKDGQAGICFTIANIPAVEPNSFVCINSGYLFSFHHKDKSMILIPQITVADSADADDFVPTVYARDSADAGFFCISGYTKSGFLGTLLVTVFAYDTKDIRTTEFQLKDSEDNLVNNVTIFKTKDASESGKRRIKNPKVKILFDSVRSIRGLKDGDKNENKKDASVDFYTLDPTKGEVQKDVFFRTHAIDATTCILFLSRKREWSNPKLFTTAGLLKAGTFVAPKVFAAEKINKNTHCLALLTGRISDIKFKEATSTTEFRLLNGFFKDMKNYAALEKILRQTKDRIADLKTGMIFCKNNGLSSSALRVYDYSRVLDIEELQQKKNYSEEQLYNLYVLNSTRNGTITSMLYRNMLFLVTEYLPSSSAIFSEEEMARLKQEVEKYKSAAVETAVGSSTESPNLSTKGVQEKTQPQAAKEVRDGQEAEKQEKSPKRAKLS